MVSAVCSDTISPSNGSVYASPSWTNREAASREDNIFLSTVMNAGNMLGGKGKQKRNGCPPCRKGKIFKPVLSHNMDAEWPWYLLTVTEEDHSPDQVSIYTVLGILRDRSIGRAWYLNKQHRQSWEKKKSLKETSYPGTTFTCLSFQFPVSVVSFLDSSGCDYCQT